MAHFRWQPMEKRDGEGARASVTPWRHQNEAPRTGVEAGAPPRSGAWPGQAPVQRRQTARGGLPCLLRLDPAGEDVAAHGSVPASGPLGWGRCDLGRR